MIRAFGGIGVDVDGVPTQLGGLQREVLAVLLAHRGSAVSTDVLTDCVWGERVPKTASKTIHVVVGRLRKLLASAGETAVIITTPIGYELVNAHLDIDEWLAALEAIASEAEAHTVTTLDLLEAQLDGASAGHPWGEFADAEWAREAAAVVHERHCWAEELWADLTLRLGGPPWRIDRFSTLVEREPLRERRWAHLMLALYRDGRQAEALRTYEAARTLLADQLGISPGPELRQVHLDVLQHHPRLDAAEPGSTVDSSPLAAYPTPMVGRIVEMARLEELLSTSRLVMITGLGGVGKTRVASEFAHRRRLVGARVKWAAFGSLPDGHAPSTHVAQALGVLADDAPSATAAAIATIGDESTLLVLDGAEVAVDAVSALIIRLLAGCPRLQIVVTTRTSLGITNEREPPIEPLPLGDDGHDITGSAFQLVLDRHGFNNDLVDDETRGHLMRLCRATGGIPLLIELHAASGEPVAVSSAVIEPYSDALRTAISTALAESDEPVRYLVAAMSPLPAGVTEQVAAVLLGTDLDTARRRLRALARVRLADTSAGLATLRYRSLDPIRQHLRAQLSPAALDESLTATNSAMLAALVQLRDPIGPVDVDRLDAVEDEHDNLRFLLGTYLTRDPTVALELAILACEYWAVRGHIVEGRRWLQRAMDASAPEGPLRWRALHATARITRTFAEVAPLRSELERGADEMRCQGGDPKVLGSLLIYLAMARGWQGDRLQAMVALDEARQISRQFGSPWVDAQISHLAALDLALAGDFKSARLAQQDFARAMEVLGDPASAATGWYVAATMGEWAGTADIADDISRARAHAESHRDIALLAQILRVEAKSLMQQGNPESKVRFEQAADQLAANGAPRSAALARMELGQLRARSWQHQRCARRTHARGAASH
jgi:DNA-binding SARP family transcriptional activator/predicted ATPase